MKTKLLSAFLVSISISLASVPSNSYALTTAGLADCGTWLGGRKSGGQNALIVQMWLLGFITGVNMRNVQNGRPDYLGRMQSTEQGFIWVDNYCHQNPLHDTAMAGLELLNALAKTPKK